MTDLILLLHQCFCSQQDDEGYARREVLAPPNVVVRALWVRNWPYLFMISCRNIKKGDDLWYDYSRP